MIWENVVYVNEPFSWPCFWFSVNFINSLFCKTRLKNLSVPKGCASMLNSNAGQCGAMRGNAGQCGAMRGTKREEKNSTLSIKTKWHIQQQQKRSLEVCAKACAALKTVYKVKNDEFIWNYSYVIKTSEDCNNICEFFHNKGMVWSKCRLANGLHFDTVWLIWTKFGVSGPWGQPILPIQSNFQLLLV